MTHSDLHKALNAAIHEAERLRTENEKLRADLGLSVRVARIAPAITIYCDAPNCTTPPLTMQVAPPEDAIPSWVRGRGWTFTLDGEGHVCPGCQK